MTAKGYDPGAMLTAANKVIYMHNLEDMFVTLWLGILEISTGKLTSASAGHEYPMINVNGKYELLKDKHGLAIGAMPNSKYKDTEITLHKGDSVFVYTDGVAEATDANNELFGTRSGPAYRRRRSLRAFAPLSTPSSRKRPSSTI